MTSIAGVNFKARSFVHNLAALSALCGLNMAGKSAVRDAIIVSLVGHSPKHGKQPRATWGFAGGRNGVAKMGVAATFDDGTFLSHDYAMVKDKVQLTTQGGPFPFVPPAMMDVRNEFLSKSGPQKVQFIFEQIDIEALGFTTEKVTARLKSDVQPDEHTEQTQACLTSIVDDVENLARERDEFKWTYQDWLNRIAQRIKDDMDAAQAVVDSMAGMIEGGTQLRAQEGLQAGQNVEADLAAARKAHQEAVLAKNNLEQRDTEHRRKTARRAQLAATLEGTDNIAALLAEAENKYQSGVADLQHYKSRTLELTGAIGKLDTEVAVCTKAIDTWTEEVQRKRDKLEADLKADCCPHCKSKGKGWKKALTESVNFDLAAIEKNIEAFRAKRVEWEVQLKPLRQQLDDSKRADEQQDSKRADHFRLGQTVKDLRTKSDQIRASRAALEEIGDVGQPITANQLADASENAERLKIRVQELEHADRQRIAAMQDAKRTEQARQQHTEKKVEVQVRKLALDVIKALRGELMDTAFKGFMAKVNLFTNGILPGALEYRDGEIGYFAGATWVALDYFSGTEEMLTLIGLSVALTQTARFKIVFVDEWLRDEQTRMAVPTRLAQLIRDKVIDQAVIIDTRADGYETIDGCVVVNIEKGKA